jgi:hypothetical protein
VVAWVEGVEVQSLAALEGVVEVRHFAALVVGEVLRCWAWAAEEAPRCWAWAVGEAPRCLALVEEGEWIVLASGVAVGWRTLAEGVAAWEPRPQAQVAQDEMQMAAEAARCSWVGEGVEEKFRVSWEAMAEAPRAYPGQVAEVELARGLEVEEVGLKADGCR